jgi:alkylation response protein AidB-like acyl-CoA dehydrogenase
MSLARDLAGARGMLQTAGPGGPGGPVGDSPVGDGPVGESTPAADALWSFGYLFAPALTIGGGTSEVQRNIIAERTLGLPHEPAP